MGFLYYILKARFYDSKFYLQQNGAQEPLNLQDLLYQNLWQPLLCPTRNENSQGAVAHGPRSEPLCTPVLSVTNPVEKECIDEKIIYKPLRKTVIM